MRSTDENRIYDINDGVPKYKDIPENFGGSGIRMTDKGKIIKKRKTRLPSWKWRRAQPAAVEL